MSTLRAAAIIIATVLSAPVSAQTPAAADPARQFSTLLDEARRKIPATAEVGTINTTLSSADWCWRRGDQAGAVSYLNFARGRLGLSHVPSGRPG